MSRRKVTPYLFLAPALILFLCFTAYPIIASLVLSFQKFEGGNYVFAGLSNYTRLLEDTVFRKALLNTLIILIIQVTMIFFC